jgi:PAS domain-containing protein
MRNGTEAGKLISRGPFRRSRTAATRAPSGARAAEDLSRVVVEELEDGVVVTDPQLRALSWNASALRILDLDPTRIAGSTASFQHHLAHRRRARQRPARTDMTCCSRASTR